jgi:hypothetical protein
MIVWETASSAANRIAVRVGLAGDFLPAWKHPAPEQAGASQRDWREASYRLAGHFEDVAISMVNCESTLESAGLEPRPLDGLGDIVSAPAACLDYLAVIRASVIGIANNHIYDFSTAGVEYTRKTILNRGFTALGAGRDLSAAPEVFVWQGPGRIRIGFWAAARAATHLSTRLNAGVEPANLMRGREALATMKQQGANFCIALLHAGCLRASHAAPEDVLLLNDLALAGFNIVAASHSHRVSGVQVIHRQRSGPAFCFYGLGSIVSGYASSTIEREGLVVVAGFDEGGAVVRVEVRPVLLDGDGFGCVPPTADGDAMLDRFQRLSAHIEDGSYSRLFYREISPGLQRLYLRDARRAFEQAGLRGLARKAQRVRMRHIRRLLHSVLR